MANLDYTRYTFEQLVAQLNAKLAEKATWTDTYVSGEGAMLIELFAAAVDMLSFYVERMRQETYLTTAKNRSSIVNAAVGTLSYLPRRKTSATAASGLTFSVPTAKSKHIPIPKYTECQTADGYKFLTNESVILSKGNLSVSADAIQGSLKTLTTTSNGLATQRYVLPETNIENSGDVNNPSLIVTVGTDTWTAVTSYIDSISTSKHYKILANSDDTITIEFGDGVAGLIPPAGSNISISYILSDGNNGNVFTSGQITQINSTIRDEDDTVIDDISVTNNVNFLNGEDEETTEHIRYYAPRIFATGDRGVTREDVRVMLEQYAGVASANVWGEKEEAEALVPPQESLESMRGIVRMCVMMNNWQDPDSSFKTLVEDYFASLAMLTNKYEWITCNKIYVAPQIDLWANRSYSLSTTENAIESTMQAAFELGVTTRIGTDVNYSDVISAIEALPQVDHINLILQLKKMMTVDYETGYGYGQTLDATGILERSVEVYVSDLADDAIYSDDGSSDTLIATDDGSGGFTNEGTVYEITSGSIDYDTGLILLNITGASGKTVYVKYEQDESRNLVANDRQIFHYVENTINFNTAQFI